MPGRYETDFAERLAVIDAAGLRRRLRVPTGIDVCSNDTLGLATHPRLLQAMRDALDTGPAGAGSARLVRGESEAFAALEARLATFVGREAALLFSSGYAANVGLLQAVVHRDDLVVSDALNHASLVDGIRSSGAAKAIYPHRDLERVAAALGSRTQERAFVVTESVFSMEGDHAPLAALAELCTRHEAALIVDEAHATGLYGPDGAGRVAELGLGNRVLASVHTGGKALGGAGAWVAGSAALREVLIHDARSFVYSTAPLPVLAAALGAAIEVCRDEPERRHEVHRKAGAFRAALAAHGVMAGGDGAIVPIVVGDGDTALRIEAALRADGFDARAIRPPTVPEGTARLRLSVRSPVSDADLERLAERLGALVATAP